MNLPPMIMRISARRQDKRMNLWLPLFIIFPFLAIVITALFLILSPLLLVAAVVLWRSGWGGLFVFFPVVLACFFALRGLEVDINQDGERVFISFK